MNLPHTFVVRGTQVLVLIREAENIPQDRLLVLGLTDVNHTIGAFCSSYVLADPTSVTQYTLRVATIKAD